MAPRALLMALPLLLPCAWGTVIPDRPDAVVCSVDDPTEVLPWNELVFWVSAHTEGGDTLYKTLTANPVVLLIGADGEVRGENLSDCNGRTVTELRRQGKAFDVVEPRARRTR